MKKLQWYDIAVLAFFLFFAFFLDPFDIFDLGTPFLEILGGGLYLVLRNKMGGKKRG